MGSLVEKAKKVLAELERQEREASRRHHAPSPVSPVEVSAIDAVRLSSPTYGELWLVRDQEALDCNPDIEASGLPVVFFAEVEVLDALQSDPTAIKRFLALKAAFPRGHCAGRNKRLH